MKSAGVILVLLLAAAPGWGQKFAFREDSRGSITVLANGKPVYTYNTGVMQKEGVPADRARCCYLHPIYTPAGVVVTDDFPADHFHHRGAFLAWPVVHLGGQRYDLWLLKGIAPRFVRVVEKNPLTSALVVENGWYAGNRKVVREIAEISLGEASASSWVLVIIYRLEAVDIPVELAGDPTDKKGYGGFNIRFGPRPGRKPADRSPEDTRIVTPQGREKADSNMVRHEWARLEGEFSGGRASLTIEEFPGNPGAPNGWCLRHYGFLGVNYPGPDQPLRLEPKQPLELRYLVTVADEKWAGN